MSARPDKSSSSTATGLRPEASESSPVQGDASGLTSNEVQVRVLAGKANAPPIRSARTVPQILRANVLTRFNAILGSLLVVVAFVGPPQDGLFGVILVVNAAIGIAQELRAKRTLDRLAVLTAPTARVRRDGELVELASRRGRHRRRARAPPWRPGGGRRRPFCPPTASRSTSHCLPARPEPVAKVSSDEVLSGSFVVAGTGVVRTTRVGADAYAQRLQADARRFDLVRSELVQGTNRILRVVTWVMVPAAALLVTSQLLRSGQTLADALRGSVAGVSAMVPEGLVLLTTIAFALGAIRLAGRRVLVQELAAIEGLARVDVVCIDKTGTLTEPGMIVDRVESASTPSRRASRSGTYSERSPDPTRHPTPPSQAIAAAFASPPGWRSVARVPFSSARKWSAATFDDRGTWVLGAPDVLLDHLRPGSSRASVIDPHTGSGQRVLLVARARDASPTTTSPTRPSSPRCRGPGGTGPCRCRGRRFGTFSTRACTPRSCRGTIPGPWRPLRLGSAFRTPTHPSTPGTSPMIKARSSPRSSRRRCSGESNPTRSGPWSRPFRPPATSWP